MGQILIVLGYITQKHQAGEEPFNFNTIIVMYQNITNHF